MPQGIQQLSISSDTPNGSSREEWSRRVPLEVRRMLTEEEINRQTCVCCMKAFFTKQTNKFLHRIIHKLISKEEQYIEDLNMVENVFIKPLRLADPPIMTPINLEDFIEEVFGNILELRECNRRLLDMLYIRQREQHPVILYIGDVFLEAATEFRTVYPTYVGHHPLAEKKMREELETNLEFRLFIEVGVFILLQVIVYRTD